MSNPDQSDADYVRDWELSQDERDEVSSVRNEEDCENEWHYDRDHPDDSRPGCGAPDIEDDGTPWAEDVVVSGE